MPCARSAPIPRERAWVLGSLLVAPQLSCSLGGADVFPWDKSSTKEKNLGSRKVFKHLSPINVCGASANLV